MKVKCMIIHSTTGYQSNKYADCDPEMACTQTLHVIKCVFICTWQLLRLICSITTSFYIFPEGQGNTETQYAKHPAGLQSDISELSLLKEAQLEQKITNRFYKRC